MKKTRNKRALKVIRMLRTRQQKQADQIDILCRDMVSAHRDFAVKLARMIDVNRFYETLLSCSTLSDILNAAVNRVEEAIASSNAAVFVLDDNGYEVYSGVESASGGTALPFQEWFSRELVLNLSLTPRVSSLNQMLQMGLQGSPAALKSISAAAIGLSRSGQAIGFIFVCRSIEEPLTAEELSAAASIGNGLCQAIANLRGLKQTVSQSQ